MATTQSGGFPSTSSHPYTCNTCQVAFRNGDLQRGHMRTDWHRYNLKRRVTSLPPITSEVFTEKVLAAQATSTAAANKASYERVCGPCDKTYFSENAYDNHVASQRHRSRIAQLDISDTTSLDDGMSPMPSSHYGHKSVGKADKADETVSDEGVTKITNKIQNTTVNDGNAKKSYISQESEYVSEENLKSCLFCNYVSPTVPLSVKHMEKKHSMFIPEKSYVVDLNGLLSTLFEKINVDHECLCCGKVKSTVFGLQTHMRDKGHCKVPYNTEGEQLEIGEFYDFTSTYTDGEEDEEEDEESSDGDDNRPQKRFDRSGIHSKGFKGEDEDDGWETDSSEASIDSADLGPLMADEHSHEIYEKLDRHPHHSSHDPRPHRNRDGYHSHAHKHAQAVFYTDTELLLPSGRAVGHRSLAKYYRQNLHNHPSPAERQEQLAIAAANESDQEIDTQVAQRNDRQRGRALVSRPRGGLGMIGVSDQKKRAVQVSEKKARKMEERERRAFQWGVNKQGNFQKHFRDPLLQ